MVTSLDKSLLDTCTNLPHGIVDGGENCDLYCGMCTGIMPDPTSTMTMTTAVDGKTAPLKIFFLLAIRFSSSISAIFLFLFTDTTYTSAPTTGVSFARANARYPAQITTAVPIMKTGREKGPRDSDACTIIMTTDWKVKLQYTTFRGMAAQ